MSNLPFGEFSSPLGILRIYAGDDEETYVSVGVRGREIIWVFKDGKFKNFEISSGDKPKMNDTEKSNSVICCEHITPDTYGTVYRTTGIGGCDMYLCPECVEVEVSVKNVPISVIDNDLWKMTVLSLDIVDIRELQ